MQSIKIIFVLLATIAALAAAEPGSILIRNYGGYMTVFKIDYDLSGSRKSVSSGDFGLGDQKEITIPDGATNVDLTAEYYWLSGPNPIFTKSYLGPVHKCFQVRGTTSNPSYDEVNCEILKA